LLDAGNGRLIHHVSHNGLLLLLLVHMLLHDREVFGSKVDKLIWMVWRKVKRRLSLHYPKAK
jgi:hypothetical protein